MNTAYIACHTCRLATPHMMLSDSCASHLTTDERLMCVYEPLRRWAGLIMKRDGGLCCWHTNEAENVRLIKERNSPFV